MKLRHIIFFLSGLIAGLISVTFGLGPPEIAIIGLTYAVGPMLFVAILAGTVFTGAMAYFRPGFVRYLGGFVLCTASYLAALITFFAVFGFAPSWFRIQASANVVEFGLDVWIGLIAAGVVAAIGIALFAALLKRKWSKLLLLQLLAAALCTIGITFVANLPFHNTWSFLGVLVPLGDALFCYVVGREIWKGHEDNLEAAAGPAIA